MNYLYQVFDAVCSVTDNLEEKKVPVIFDMMHYGSKNFKMFIDKETGKIEIIELYYGGIKYEKSKQN